MTLRQKTLLIVSLGFAGLIIALYAGLRTYAVRDFGGLEIENARRNADHAVKAMEYDLNLLSRAASDYAFRDETYSFVDNPDPQYLKSELPDSALNHLRINLAVMVNSSGRPVFIKAFDLETKKETSPPDKFQRQFDPSDALLRHTDTNPLTGLLALPEGPMLSVSCPVLTSQKRGPSRGTLIFGRYLNGQEAARVAEVSGLPIDLRRIGDEEMPSDFREAIRAISNGAESVAFQRDENAISTYKLIRDIYGQPALLLKVTGPRTIYREGLEFLWWLTISSLVVIFLFGAIVWLLVEKMVTSKLITLNSGIHRIGTSGDLSQRLPLDGRDEIAGVVIAVNSMLETLERSHHRLSESEERYRRLVEFSPEGIAVHQDGRVVYVNQQGATMMGASSPEELIGLKVIDLIHPDYREIVLQRTGRLDNGKPAPAIEEKLVRLDGKVIDVEVTGIPFTFEGRPAAQVLVRDITERKRSEEARRESEQRFRILAEHVPGVIYMCYNDDRYSMIYLNDEVENLTGYAKEEFLENRVSFFDLYHPEDARWIPQEVNRRLEERKPFHLIYRIHDRAGEWRWVEERGVGVFRDDELLFLEGFISDITERKLAEDSLRASEEKYRELVENIDEVIFAVDEYGRVIYVSQAIESVGGYSVSEIVGKDFVDFIHEEDRPSAIGNFQKTFSGHVEPYEYRAFDKAGQVRWIRTSSRPIYEGDRIVGLRGVLTDITERKRAEEALAAEKERLAVTLRSIGDGVIATDTEGKIVLINKVAEQLTGWSQEEALGRPLGEVFNIINEKTRQAIPNPVEKVLATGEVVGLANRTALIAKDGAEKKIADSGAPIMDRQSRVIGVVLAFRDVTEKEKIEGELLKASKLESLGVLAGGIAHDFNNVLTAILANISLAKTSLLLDESVYSSLDEAEQACLKARDMTQQLLTFSKGGAPVRKTASVVELIRESASFALSGSNVRCEFDLPSSLWPVEIDEGQMSQVIHNLTLNAQQAMPEGGTIHIRAENFVSEAAGAVPAGRYVKISVIDSGTGIPEDHLPIVFDPYFTTKQKGSGLGLATSYSMVRKHDGFITVDSRIGEGATFSIYLPASTKEIQAKKDEHLMTAANSGKILLMDDEDRIRTVTSQILRMLGYEVEMASDGAQAVEMYSRAIEEGRPFNLVILDLTIPGGMGGKEAIKKLHEIDPNVKAIVSSGYSNDPIMAGFSQYGFSGIVAKPYRVAELKKVINDVIRGHDQ